MSLLVVGDGDGDDMHVSVAVAVADNVEDNVDDNVNPVRVRGLVAVRYRTGRTLMPLFAKYSFNAPTV